MPFPCLPETQSWLAAWNHVEEPEALPLPVVFQLPDPCASMQNYSVYDQYNYLLATGATFECRRALAQPLHEKSYSKSRQLLRSLVPRAGWTLCLYLSETRCGWYSWKQLDSMNIK